MMWNMFTLIFKILVQMKIKILIEQAGASRIYLVLLRVFVDPKLKISGFEVLVFL